MPEMTETIYENWCAEVKYDVRFYTGNTHSNMVETTHAQSKITKINKSCVEHKTFHVTREIDVAEFISSDRFTIGSKINALTVHAQTLVSCLKQTALDRL